MLPTTTSLFDKPGFSTRVLLVICVLNFALMAIVDRRIPLFLFGDGSGMVGPPAIRSLILSGGIFGSLVDREPFRLLSAVYVHLGLDHLLLNMSALVSLGKHADAQIGGARVVVLFIICGVVGFIASRIYFGPVSPPTAGASGALFGFIGADIAGLLARKDPRARQVIMEELAYAVGFALLFSTNNAAHFGGFVAGLAVGSVFVREQKRAQLEPVFRALAWTGIAVSICSVVLSVRSVLLMEA